MKRNLPKFIIRVTVISIAICFIINILTTIFYNKEIFSDWYKVYKDEHIDRINILIERLDDNLSPSEFNKLKDRIIYLLDKK